MLRKFDQTDYTICKEYEDKFKSAIESRFVTGLTSDSKQNIHKIYKECLGRQANLNCSGCILNMLVGVGTLYFNYKASIENENNQNEKRSKNTKQKKHKQDS